MTVKTGSTRKSCPQNRLVDTIRFDRHEPMTWLKLESKMFTAAAYDGERKILYLRFTSGDVYRYLDLSPDTWQTFLAADSRGRFFLAEIRGKFRYERMAKLRAP